MVALILTSLLTFAIGISLGISGYGGFLIPPILVVALHMGAQDAVAHGLLSFILPGLVSAYMYWRRPQSPSWEITIWLSVGTVPGVIVGRVLSGLADQHTLTAVLAVLVSMAGAYLLLQRSSRRRRRDFRSLPRAISTLICCVAGFAGGAAAVLTGVGGPLLTVPVLVAAGYEVSRAVGAAILNAVLVAALAAGSLLTVVTIEPITLAVVSATLLVSMVLGVRWQPKIRSGPLVVVIGIASILVGAGLGLKLWWQ